MIPIVENLLTEIIESRLKYIKDNPDIVDRIFSQANVTMRSRLKEYITNGNIKTVRGFPDTRAKLPCYAIMLGGEREQEKVLGTYLGDDDDNVLTVSTSENLVVTRNDGKLIVKVTNKPIFTIDSVVFNGITYSVSSLTILDPNLGYVEIGEEIGAVYGDSVTLGYTYFSSGNEQYGAVYNTQYRIETWTNNGDLTVMLYHLLKWMILSSRDTLEEEGLTMQTLGGMDFEPAPDYMPELVYRRALTFECITENSFDLEFEYIQSIELNGNIEEGK